MADIPVSSNVIASVSSSGALSVRNTRLTAFAMALVVASGSMTVKSSRLEAAATARSSASSELTVRNAKLQASVPALTVFASSELTVRGQSLKSSVFAKAASSGDMLVTRRITALANCEALSRAHLAVSLNMGALSRVGVTARGCLDRGRDAIGVCEVMADILHLWGFTNPRTAPGYAVSRALTDLNSALQTVWNQAENRDYWSKETLEISLAALSSSQVLPDTVQNVTGTCRIKDSRRPMTNCGTLSELEVFPDLYLDGGNASEPVAYHIERQSQNANDPVKCTFHVTPAPSEDTEFLIEVVKEAPRFGIRDFTDCPRIPIPHRYVESLLLPVVRYRATSYYLFTDQAKKAAIDADYAEARAALGMADPLPGNAGDNRGERKEEAR